MVNAVVSVCDKPFSLKCSSLRMYHFRECLDYSGTVQYDLVLIAGHYHYLSILSHMPMEITCNNGSLFGICFDFSGMLLIE